MKLALLALVVFASLGILTLREAAPHAFEAAPPAPKNLLVAVDLVSGNARALKLLDDEPQCAKWAGDVVGNDIWREAVGARAAERVECRVPR